MKLFVVYIFFVLCENTNGFSQRQYSNVYSRNILKTNENYEKYNKIIMGSKHNIEYNSLYDKYTNETPEKVNSIYNKMCKPRTKNQETYVDYLKNTENTIVFGLGPAGSGKTMFACSIAIADLKLGNVKKIVLTRPIVSVDEELGFLPGSLIEKMSPWTRPIFDILLEYFKQSEIDAMVRDGIIEISPLAYMRGRTFKNTWIIADEMQNSSPNQMLMLTTRIGDNSRMVITGDLAQSDRIGENGLSDFLKKYRKYNDTINSTVTDNNNNTYIRIVEMNTLDIQRNPIVSKVLNIYSQEIKQSEQSKVLEEIKKNEEPKVEPKVEPKKIKKQKTEEYSVKVNIESCSNPRKIDDGCDDAAMIPKKYFR